MSDLELGTQPIEQRMEAWGITNQDLVNASTEQLTYKQVQRAKSGRKLTLKMMFKLARSFNVAIWNKLSKTQKEQFSYEYLHRDLFSYAKGYDENFADPNEALRKEVMGETE